MQDTNALFDSLLAAYRNADDPDRFLREFLIRLDDATANAVVAAERKLDKLDAARARLEAAREIPRPDVSEDGADAPSDVEDEPEPEADADADEEQDIPEEEDEAPPQQKRRKATGKRTPAR